MPVFGHEITLQVDLATTAIAVMAFLVSFWLGWRQSRLDVESLRQQRDTDIIHWSNSALGDYAAVVEPNPYERERFKVLEDLSYAIDAGRLYFPNSEADKYGLHKEGAFRGVRHPVLDMLVRVYDLLEKVTHQVPASPEERSELREQVNYCRREFISRVQAQVDPRRRVNFLTN